MRLGGTYNLAPAATRGGYRASSLHDNVPTISVGRRHSGSRIGVVSGKTRSIWQPTRTKGQRKLHWGKRSSNATALRRLPYDLLAF